MIVCPDCRNAVPCQCGWKPVGNNYLSTGDRKSIEAAEYIDTYNVLAERNMVVPVEPNSYVEQLAVNFLSHLGVGNQDFCDVGSGRGFAVKHALKLGAKTVTAVDIVAPALANISRKYAVSTFVANAESLPFESEFDVIAATDILEHVLNVGNFLCCANWALRDSGILGIRVPYMENMLLYSNYHGLPMHYTHLRTFDKRTLVDLIEQAGFKVVKILYDGWNPDYPNAIGRLIPALRKYRFGKRPIEIGVVAKKIDHIKAVNAHSSLAEFVASMKGRA